MIKNELLREAGENIEYNKKQILEFARCRQDIFYFAEKYFKTRNAKTGEVANIKLYPYQKKIINFFVNPPENKRNIIIMQPRQSGKTTVVSLYILHFLLFNTDKTSMILAQVEKTALEIMEKIKKSYELLPKWLQQGVCLDGWNKKSIKLENGCRCFCSTTSGVSSAGFTIDLLYLDEFALIPNNLANDFYASVYPTVTAVPGSKIIITSTPRGLNKFHDIWKSAKEGKNNFYAFKVEWNEPPADGGKPRDEVWLSEQIATLGNSTVQREFLCNFLGSSSTLVDTSRLERLNAKDPIQTWYNGLLSIYELPIRNSKYVIGVDSSSGTGKDFSVLQVLKYVSDREVSQVATYRNDSIDPYVFAQLVIAVSDFYNFCPIMAEYNNGCGETFCRTLFYDLDCERLVNCDKAGLGVLATKKSKFNACMNLRRYFDNGWVDIVDSQTIYELSRFEETNNAQTFAATGEEHDDTVTSLYWALYYFNTEQYEGIQSGFSRATDKFKVDIELQDNKTVEEEDRPIFGSTGDVQTTDNWLNGSGMYGQANEWW